MRVVSLFSLVAEIARIPFFRASERNSGLPLHRRGGRPRGFPQSKAASESIGVGAGANAFGERLELLGVAAADHDIVGQQGRLQASNDVGDGFAPLELT